MKKRIFAAIKILAAVCAIVFLAYIVGHRHGVIHAELRTMSYELMAFSDFVAGNPDSAKNKLGHLINLREDSISDEITIFEDWNYWRQVRWDEFRKDNTDRLSSLADEIPPRMTVEQMQAEVEKELSEQGVAPQSATRSESDSEGGHNPQPELEERSR